MTSSLATSKASQFGGVLLLLFLGFSSAWPVIQENDVVSLPDNSDWWSQNRTSEPDEVQPKEREFPGSAFRVLGVNLGEKMFSQASSRLGKATPVQRGDASTGRLQACYVSLGGQKNVHLIFEQGEVNFAFYMFVD